MNPASIHRLLDVECARDLIAAVRPRARQQAVAFDALWAKPGRYFNVCYRVGESAQAERVSLCIVDTDAGARAMRWCERLHESRQSRSDAGAPLAMPAPDVLAQVFPFDYRLPRLVPCVEPSAAAPVLGDGVIDSCAVVAYRPGMRCQLRYSAGGVAVAYGKHAIERENGRRRRVHAALYEAMASGTMLVPRPVGNVEAIDLDLVAAVPGRTLHDVLLQDPDPAPVVATLRSLREMHDRVPPPADRVYTPADEVALLASWVSWIGGIEPELAERTRATLASLGQQRPDTSPSSLAHRDFYDKQVLIEHERRWLLDVDTACTGDRELDVGNFLAHLFLRALQWDRRDRHRDLEAAAEEAYGPAARRRVTRWYRRASLLRLACAYALRPHWRHLVPDLLEEAGRA